MVGVLSGFFGFGGGFILTPFLISLGFPANLSIGTTMTQIFMSSIAALVKHKRLGNIDLRSGLIIAVFSFFGAEAGAQLIEYLKRTGTYYLNFIVSLSYAVILGLISLCIFYEKYRANRQESKRRNLLKDKVRRVRIPPVIDLPKSESGPISLWIIVLIGLCTGFLAGFLGAGGGFILVPILIYVIGYSPPIAVGTCAFQMVLNCAYASFTHATKGNVLFQIAALTFIGSFIGLQVGISAVKHVDETKFKTAFAFCLGSISLGVVIRLLSKELSMPSLEFLSQVIMLLSAFLVALFIMISTLIRQLRGYPKIINK
ncbi:MAG: sulfite exporter TauE/SafE family protein [Candidatus Bathyarchaeia archaeon]